MKIQHAKTREIIEKGVKLYSMTPHGRVWVHHADDRTSFLREWEGWSEVKEAQWVDVTGEVQLSRTPSGMTTISHRGTSVDINSNYRFRHIQEGYNRNFIIIEQKVDSE